MCLDKVTQYGCQRKESFFAYKYPTVWECLHMGRRCCLCVRSSVYESLWWWDGLVESGRNTTVHGDNGQSYETGIHLYAKEAFPNVASLRVSIKPEDVICFGQECGHPVVVVRKCTVPDGEILRFLRESLTGERQSDIWLCRVSWKCKRPSRGRVLAGKMRDELQRIRGTA